MTPQKNGGTKCPFFFPVPEVRLLYKELVPIAVHAKVFVAVRPELDP